MKMNKLSNLSMVAHPIAIGSKTFLKQNVEINSYTFFDNNFYNLFKIKNNLRDSFKGLETH